MSQQNWEWTLLPPKSICPSNCKTKVFFFVPPMIIALLFSLFGHRTTTATKKSVIPVLYRLIMISMCWCQLLNKAENKALISYGTYTTQIVYLYFPDKTERFTVSHATSLRSKIHSKLRDFSQYTIIYDSNLKLEITTGNLYQIHLSLLTDWIKKFFPPFLKNESSVSEKGRRHWHRRLWSLQNWQTRNSKVNGVNIMAMTSRIGTIGVKLMGFFVERLQTDLRCHRWSWILVKSTFLWLLLAKKLGKEILMTIKYLMLPDCN